MDFILVPLLSIGGLAAFLGLALGVAEKLFAVEHNPVVDKILNALPGVNCGGCGFVGCGSFAEAAAAGKAPPTGCPVGGKETAEEISNILGVELGKIEKTVAFVKCAGDCHNSKTKYVHDGVIGCAAASMLAGGGEKECPYGCEGLGTCKKVCKYDAIEIVNDLAAIDEDKCVSCGACVEVCPKSLIEIEPYKKATKVACNSKEKGRLVRERCDVGCIGCKICVKTCKYDAIDFEDNLAYINHNKCVHCGECAEKCPTKAIKFTPYED